MLGAIIGDIAGSRFEFNNYRKTNFIPITSKCYFTDDTVMTCAVMDWLKSDRKNPEIYLQKWARKYPYCSYGNSFSYWIYESNPKPYYSFGNGAAMRISPVGWISKSEKEVKQLSYQITSITHNHPEGIKGAEVVAMCIYKALHNENKKQILEYVKSKYPRIIILNYKDLIKNYKFNETCQETVPQAIYCFLISRNFKDCLKKTISIGGDSDTLAAISCSIAEAYYKKIPKNLIRKSLKILPDDIKKTLISA